MAFVPNLGLAFADIVHQHGDRTALSYPESGIAVTYAELAGLANDAAATLQSRGVQPGEVVALFHDKSPEAYAFMLACLQRGNIYTNLEPECPWERLSKILDVCQPKLIVNAFPETHVELKDVLPLRPLPKSGKLGTPPTVSGGSPAYIMFTSGSTGQPKGAVMSHANVLWFLTWARDRFALTPDDVFSGVNPVYFDNSVFDFYGAIFTGATLVPFSAEQVRDPRRLVRLIGQAGCTVWFSVPSLLVYLLTTRTLTVSDFSSVRMIIFGGEAFPKPKLKQLHELFAHRAALENVYGPTECTCICSAHRVETADLETTEGFVTLGHLAPNFDCEILPQGELFLRGPQVGLGYYREPERTALSFTQNPNHQAYADVGYCTGDVVERDAQGRLHFKGRRDFQIKHLGYRIELEEIEAALAAISGVHEAAAIYQVLGEGLGQIVAVVATGDPISPEEIQKQAALRLSSYMVPRRVLILKTLPKNPNGKIDRPELQKLALASS